MKKKTLRKDEDDESEYLLIIRANNNTMNQINFTKPHNIGSLLEFSSTYTETATMARIGCIDKYYQRKHYLRAT